MPRRDRWNDLYKLVDGKIVRCSLLEWAQWLQENASGPREQDQRIVAKTRIGRYLVSTVFLGLDHSFGGPIPVLWETMVFEPNPKAGEMTEPDRIETATFETERCGGSIEQAEAMHQAKVAEVCLLTGSAAAEEHQHG